MKENRTPRGGFTMIELMVVIAVIALLIAVLMPALSMVKTSAKVTATQAQFTGLETGIQAFSNESVAGGRFPPSASDNSNNSQQIANPRGTTDNPDMPVSGAHLLVHAMLGADLLGAPGFIDVSAPRDGIWCNDTHMGPDGLYDLDENNMMLPTQARYGGAGYVEDKMKARAKALRVLMENGTIAFWSDGDDQDVLSTTGEQFLFVDPWDHPILYYRANPAAIRMLRDYGSGTPGIYQQEDNGLITGSDAAGYVSDGIDFGAGVVNTAGSYHDISNSASPDPNPATDDVQGDATYDNSFARFIFDSSVLGRNTPVRKDSYLLISAGPDGRYGTTDDITNWTRERD